MSSGQTRIKDRRYLPGLEIGALLVVVQMLWGGYRFGTGNQAIQLVFLKHLLDPGLYATDPLIGTLSSYPSAFLQWVARLVSLAHLQEWYFGLHALTALGMLIGGYLLATAMFRSRATGLLAVLMLLAGHHQALASTTLYWQQFTHTWVASTGIVLVLVLYFKDRWVGAALLTGILFNVHALLAGYALVILGFGAVMDARRLGVRRLLACVAAFTCLASPTLAALLAHPHTWDANWLRLVHIRSAAHSFPLSWWQSGRTEIPRFLTVTALGIIAMGFRMPEDTRRKTGAVVAACIALFAAGVAGSELVPVPVIIRAQLFRSSALLYLIMIMLIAHGITSAWHRRASSPAPDRPRGSFLCESVAAGFLLPILVFPGLITLLPAALLAMAAAALVSGRLSLTQATLAGVALLSAFMAHHDLHFTLFSLPSAPFGRELQLLHYPEIRMALLALAAVALSVFLPAGRLTAWLIRPATVLCVAALLTQVYERTGSAEDGGDRWVQAQLWARQHTPVGAVFLTPSAPGGFRIHSERGVVGEWRDGTQQYFDPAFASLWWQRMEALQPGVRYDASGTRQVSEGQPLTDLSDDALEAICRQFGASYLVLPAASSRDFVPCYRNRDWRIYRAERAAPLPPPPDAVNPEVWLQQQAFLEDTVRPNIRRFRTSDVRIQVVNAGGLPLRDRPFAVQQTDSLFRFGSALGYFIRPPVTTNRGDGSAYTVIPKELEYFPQIFNFSVTGYSGKWAAMEPEQGRVTYEDLDQYVDWCRQHQVRIQFHFVTGYEPRWLKALPPEEQEVCLTRRTGELLARYGDRIETWQVINEKHLLKLSPSAFKLMHKTSPDLPLGISDCALFWSAKPPPAREKEMTRGMLDQLAWLREQGARVDFVGLHGHRPFQLWADLRDLYKLFDLFAREGVRIYVTEFGVETGSSIVGPVRSGTWTDELQAEYYALVFETCFSHPAVDGINFWGIGPHTFVKRAGLLDENYEPKPAFHTLRRLIRETWRTGVSGTLGLDGGIAFRGYHGDYTLTLSRRDGQQTNLAFRVQPGSNAVFRFTVPDE